MAEISELYERLKGEWAHLNNEMEQIRAKMRPLNERREGSPFGKKEEEADEVFELEKRLALEKQLTESLAEVEHALKKYESGTYGICDRCGQPIEPARLEALPHANSCVTCKTQQMKNAKSRLAR